MIFRSVYSCFPQPVESKAKITVTEVSQTNCQKVTSWLTWIVSTPFVIPQKLYHFALFLKNQEMLSPIEASLVPTRQFHTFGSVPNDQIVLTNAQIAGKLLRCDRNDPSGVFGFGLESDSSRLFLPLVKEITQAKTVTIEDFLFTCTSTTKQTMRSVILSYLGPEKITEIRDRINTVVQRALEYLKSQEEHGCVTISAKDFSGMFTLAMITDLLLGKTDIAFEENHIFYTAIKTCILYAMMALVLRPSKEMTSKYKQSIQTLRNLIESSEGPFHEKLELTSLSSVQKKGLLLLLYIAGGETSASLIEYLLLQLGQKPALQSAILEQDDNLLLKKTIDEGLRLHTPTGLIARTTRKALQVRVENPSEQSWSYLIPSRTNIIYTPYFAGRDPIRYSDAETFNPQREETLYTQSWHPFSRHNHSCPGKWLALSEVEKLLIGILRLYNIQSSTQGTPQPKQLMTLSLDRDSTITFTRRESERKSK